ncbi:hypothetical protein SAMN05660297_01982 [Natronincola peptidivorans]|uniref:Uncharacterized protein n=1 Tax=Natronincola peptidivorans TaxID=426128 RepID=A0A1I0DE59_9FIRM|nr:hypothetical protein SAMN05660297_01982 [Natronincola peptidivorans]
MSSTVVALELIEQEIDQMKKIIEETEKSLWEVLNQLDCQ